MAAAARRALEIVREVRERRGIDTQSPINLVLSDGQSLARHPVRVRLRLVPARQTRSSPQSANTITPRSTTPPRSVTGGGTQPRRARPRSKAQRAHWWSPQSRLPLIAPRVGACARILDGDRRAPTMMAGSRSIFGSSTYERPAGRSDRTGPRRAARRCASPTASSRCSPRLDSATHIDTRLTGTDPGDRLLDRTALALDAARRPGQGDPWTATISPVQNHPRARGRHPGRHVAGSPGDQRGSGQHERTARGQHRTNTSGRVVASSVRGSPRRATSPRSPASSPQGRTPAMASSQPKALCLIR